MQDRRRTAPSSDPQKVCAHIKQIGMYMFSREKLQTRVGLAQSGRVDRRKRAATIDWMSTVASDFKLLEKTLALAVEVLDLFLERASERTEPDEYPFLGVAALFMASKYEEIYPPNAQVGRER